MVPGVADDVCRLRSVFARQHSRCREGVRLTVSVQHSALPTDDVTYDDCQHRTGELLTWLTWHEWWWGQCEVIVCRILLVIFQLCNAGEFQWFSQSCPMWAWEHCRIGPLRFLAKNCTRRLNQGSFVLLCFALFAFSVWCLVFVVCLYF